MKRLFLVLALALTLMGASGIARAAEWECSLDGATQKVILAQQGEPEKIESGEVKGTVTWPYGRKHDAEVRIDGFDRRWDYMDGDGRYSVIMQPSGYVGLYDFTGIKEGELREEYYALFCEESMTDEERRLDEEKINALRYDYTQAVRQKVEPNWIKPVGGGEIPLCKVHIEQGPRGIILDVDFGPCGDSTAAYRASIENAVFKAEPLPAPGDQEMFTRYLNFYFDPSVQ